MAGSLAVREGLQLGNLRRNRPLMQIDEMHDLRIALLLLAALRMNARQQSSSLPVIGVGGFDWLQCFKREISVARIDGRFGG